MLYYSWTKTTTKSKTLSTVSTTKWTNKYNRLFPSIMCHKRYNLQKLSRNWERLNMILWKVGLLPVRKYSSVMDKFSSLKLKICPLSCRGSMVRKVSTLEYIKSKSARQGSPLFKTQGLLFCRRLILILTPTLFIRVSLTDSRGDSNSSKVSIFKLLFPNLQHWQWDWN